MRGTKLVLDASVVLRPRVDVLDQQRDGRTRRGALEHTGQNSDLVGLAPLGGVAGLAGAPAVQIFLQVRRAELEPGRTAIDDTPDGGPVTLAERGHGEQLADGVSGHG